MANPKRGKKRSNESKASTDQSEKESIRGTKRSKAVEETEKDPQDEQTLRSLATQVEKENQLEVTDKENQPGQVEDSNDGKKSAPTNAIDDTARPAKSHPPKESELKENIMDQSNQPKDPVIVDDTAKPAPPLQESQRDENIAPQPDQPKDADDTASPAHSVTLVEPDDIQPKFNPVDWPDYPPWFGETTRYSSNELFPLPYQILQHDKLPICFDPIPHEYMAAWKNFEEIHKSRQKKEYIQAIKDYNFRICGAVFSPGNLETLAGDAWLNDEIIYCSFLWAKQRFDSLENVAFLSPFLLAKYTEYQKNFFKDDPPEMDKRYDRKCPEPHYPYSYGQIQKWFKSKYPDRPNPLQWEKIIIFNNEGRMHWNFGVIYPQSKTFELYDSVVGPESTAYAMFNWFRDECYSQGTPIVDSEWIVISHRGGMPHQLDSNNCGVFTIMRAIAIACGHDVRLIDGELIQLCGRISIFTIFYQYWKSDFFNKKRDAVIIETGRGGKSLNVSEQDQKHLLEKFGITKYGKKTVESTQEGCPSDQNWVDPLEGDIWQFDSACAAGPLCNKHARQHRLTKFYRCIVCGFACHSLCSYPIKDSTQEKNVVCQHCVDFHRLNNHLSNVTPKAKKPTYVMNIAGTLHKILLHKWKPLCLVRDPTVVGLEPPIDPETDKREDNVFQHILDINVPPTLVRLCKEEKSSEEVLEDGYLSLPKKHEGEGDTVTTPVKAVKRAPTTPPSSGVSTRRSGQSLKDVKLQDVAQKVQHDLDLIAEEEDAFHVPLPPLPKYQSPSGRPPLPTKASRKLKKKKKEDNAAIAERNRILGVNQPRFQPDAKRKVHADDVSSDPEGKSSRAAAASLLGKDTPASTKDRKLKIQLKKLKEKAEKAKKDKLGLSDKQSQPIRKGTGKLKDDQDYATDRDSEDAEPLPKKKGTGKLKNDRDYATDRDSEEAEPLPKKQKIGKPKGDKGADTETESEVEEQQSSKTGGLKSNNVDKSSPTVISQHLLKLDEYFGPLQHQNVPNDTEPPSTDNELESDDDPEINKWTKKKKRPGFSPAESTFLDDFEEAARREVEVDPDATDEWDNKFEKAKIDRAAIWDKRQLEKRSKLPPDDPKLSKPYKACQLVYHKRKTDFCYRPRGRREEALVYETDSDDYEYLYEPSEVPLTKSRPWKDIPWMYKDLYIARVHKLDKMLGVKLICGMVDPRGDVVMYNNFLKHHNYTKEKIHRDLANEESKDRRDEITTYTLMLDKKYDEFRAKVQKEMPLRLVKTAFRLWWNREGRYQFSDHIWIDEPRYGTNLHQVEIARQKLKKEKEQKRKQAIAEQEIENRIAAHEALKLGAEVYKRHKKNHQKESQISFIKGMEKEYPSSNYRERTSQDIKFRATLTRYERAKMDWDDKEADELGMLQFVKYNPTTKFPAHYRGRVKDGSQWVDCRTEHIEPAWIQSLFDKSFWGMLMHRPGQWFHVPIGSQREDIAPPNLFTNTPCHFVQANKDFCLFYCLASAIHYMGLENEAKRLAEVADTAMDVDGKSAMDSLLSWMLVILPSIAGYEAFGSFKKKKKDKLVSIRDICDKQTPYPTVIIPLGKDKSVNHAVCVIDDLIFDSTQKNALKLKKQSLDWIVQGPGLYMIEGAIRFHRKTRKDSPTIRREVSSNW